MTGAVVLTEHIRGLGVVRSLGRRGIPVVTLSPPGDALSRASRYACDNFPWPSPDENRQLSYLFELADRHDLDGWTLFAASDETTAFCARRAAELSSRFRSTVPPWDIVRWAYDKRLTYRIAAITGIDQPKTFFPIDRDHLETLDLSFPVVLKPAYKREVNRFTKDKVWRADTPEVLAARYDEACALVEPGVLMVQELIPGGGEAQFSYATLCCDGRPLASVTARRTRQYPIDFGHSSSFVETVDRPEVEQAAQRFLAASRYTGLAEVEFKYDDRDGRYKLLEVNPRVWTWHSLCHRAGVDFPYLLWRMAQGERISELRGRSGLKWVRMSTDLVAAIGEIRRRRLTFAGYLASLRGPIGCAVMAADDPVPGVLNCFAAVWSRVNGRIGLIPSVPTETAAAPKTS
jgi:D-aspartate ligase